jgi:hypothetical protein
MMFQNDYDPSTHTKKKKFRSSVKPLKSYKQKSTLLFLKHITGYTLYRASR